MFAGGLLASTGYRAGAGEHEREDRYVNPVAAADDLTQRDLDKYPYHIRTGWTSSQPSHPFGQWACDQGYKKIVAIGADYAFGYEVVGGFQKAFEDCGGKIVQKICRPRHQGLRTVYTNDQAGCGRDLHAHGSARCRCNSPSSCALRQQEAVIGGGTSYDEFVLPSMGDEVIGDVSALQYSAALDTPKNAEFVKNIAPSTARCRPITRRPTTRPRR
jgi:branched-chain amino acid transport system substrate-binding protein